MSGLLIAFIAFGPRIVCEELIMLKFASDVWIDNGIVVLLLKSLVLLMVEVFLTLLHA